MEIDMMITTILIISPPAVLWFVLSCNKAIYIAANPDPGAKNNFSMTVVIKMMMMVTVVIKMMMMVLACSWSILGHQVFPQINILNFSQPLCQTNIFFFKNISAIKILNQHIHIYMSILSASSEVEEVSWFSEMLVRTLTRVNTITQANTITWAFLPLPANTITWANAITLANTITQGSPERDRVGQDRKSLPSSSG